MKPFFSLIPLFLPLMVLAGTNGAGDKLTNVYWNLIGDSTSTAQQEAFIATYTSRVPFYQDGVSAIVNHPKEGIGAKIGQGVYFHEASSSKGDNYIRITVPAGQKGVFRLAWRPRNTTSGYTFYAIVQDSATASPVDIYKSSDKQHQIGDFTAQSDYSEVMLEKRFDFSKKTNPQSIYVWFPATGLRYRGCGWKQLPDSTVIDDPLPEDDTTHIPASDTLPDPLPRYNADFTKTIRILGIGNSFTVDLFDQYFVPLCQTEGLNVIVGYPYHGGTTIREHVNYYQSTAKVYDYRKWVNGKLSKSGENTQTLNYALHDEPWDIVLIQSRGSAENYIAASDGMNELINIIKKEVSAPKLCQHVTWADALCGDLMGCKTQQERTDSLLFWGARNFNRFHYDYLSPVGRAIQNARTSFLGDNLNRDCHHLNMSEGRYIAALVFYEILTGKSCIGTTFCPASMTAYRAQVCQYAAHYAVLSPLKTTDMSNKYGIEKGVDPLKSITVDGIRYSGVFTTIYADATNAQTAIHLDCGKDSSVVVTTPEKGSTKNITISLVGSDGATYNHTLSLLGADFSRYLWNAISSNAEVSPTQDSICTGKILPRGECTLQAFSKGGNAGTGATTGYYIAANSEANPKCYTKLTVPGHSKGILNVVARLGTALKNAVPPYPFYAYIQDADKADPATLYSTVTIGDAANLAFYPSLDNYGPLVMDGLYCDFSDKKAQHIYIYNTGNAQRYRSIEYIILDTNTPASLPLTIYPANPAVTAKKILCGERIVIVRGNKQYTPQGLEIQ